MILTYRDANALEENYILKSKIVGVVSEQLKLVKMSGDNYVLTNTEACKTLCEWRRNNNIGAETLHYHLFSFSDEPPLSRDRALKVLQELMGEL